MYLSFCVNVLLFVCSFTEAFFLFAEKPEPVLFCLKVCPLYCSPRKRRDVGEYDYASKLYWDEPPFTSISDDHIIEDFPPPFYNPYFFCKPPKKTTTTSTTTTVATTTEEPTWICMVCLKKCNYPKKS